MKKITVFIFCLLISSSIFSKQRTLYVDDFVNIIGSPGKENRLLLFAKKNNFKTLILYQLNKVDKKWTLSDPRKNNILAEFIVKAKTEFSINSIGASGECASFFTNTIDPYNNSRNKAEEKFDIYNLEYEYWSKNASGENGYYCVNYLNDNSIPCNRTGSYNFFIDNLKELKNLSKNNIHNIKIEAYLNYYSQKELSNIVKYCDRLIIQTSGKNPRNSFVSAKKSLAHLSKINSKVKTSILYSTRMNHMGFWFKSNSLESSEKDFFNLMDVNNTDQSKNINLDGFSYHTYSFLEKSISYYSYTRN
ncbi:hypothetical protein [Polaribacter sp. Asnod6-C07]|uniref:hypothetical protein n=1 Tax=Polaribacter sp. Asnod6-C07 TaxID=3160582 RepID=UPI00386C20D9